MAYFVNGNTPSSVRTNITGNIGNYDTSNIRKIEYADSAGIDAFGKLRTSFPETLFDSKNIFRDSGIALNAENQPCFYDNQEVSGSGTATEYLPYESSTKLTVSANIAGTRVRQTKQRMNYQPGKSQSIMMSFIFGEQKTGITRREGLFDENNGIFLEDDGTNYYIVVRSNTTGTPVDTKYAQSEWNIDKFDGSSNGITLDFEKTQILAIDYEWLGVGRVRAGFVINGLIYYCHEFNHANNTEKVYMQTPNLPLRSEISNNGSGEAASIYQICSTVISEGGTDPLGCVRYASTNGTHVDADTENVIYAVLGIKLKPNYIGEFIKILNTSIQLQTAEHKCEWLLLFNPTVAGTFTYLDEDYSAVRIARGATANTVTGGIRIGGGYVETGKQDFSSNAQTIENSLRLGTTIAGVSDSIVLCVRPVGGSSNIDVEGSLTWREAN